jgi:hypothetical protein
MDALPPFAAFLTRRPERLRPLALLLAVVALALALAAGGRALAVMQILWSDPVTVCGDTTAGTRLCHSAYPGWPVDSPRIGDLSSGK